MVNQSPETAAAVARLDARLEGYERLMKAWMESVQRDVSEVQGDVKAMRSTLDEARGGMNAARWIFGGSLAAVIATFAWFGGWLKSIGGH